MTTSPQPHTFLALALGLTAALANVAGGLLILQREWSREYLKYFVALGAGFMLGAAFLEMLPESVRPAKKRITMKCPGRTRPSARSLA